MIKNLLIVLLYSINIFVDHGNTYLINKDSRDEFRTKRHVRIPGKNDQTTSKVYQECTAPGSRPGHCKHLSSCGDDVFRSNFPRLTDYLCIIEGQFIGVCCPDDAPGTSENDALPAGGLAGILPAIATDAEDPIVFDEDTSVSPRKNKIQRGCGVSSRKDTGRISGGHPTDSSEWPWIAAILKQNIQKVWIQFCGGVLITDRHIMTAGHCVHLHRPKDLRVRLGEYDLRFQNESRALEFKVVEIRIHKGYVHTTYKHDIAILKINPPTVFNTYIWPICLPPVGAVFENKTATVIGWGTMSYGGTSSNQLMEVDVPVWQQKQCADSFVQEITSDQLCAGVYAGNGDACQGDSGGPLLHRLGNKRWVTIGIVSWGIGCGSPRKPGIYTRVNAYLDWIFANTVF